MAFFQDKLIMARPLSLEEFPDIFGFVEFNAVADGSMELDWMIPGFFTLKNVHLISPMFEFLGVELNIILILIHEAYFIKVVHSMKKGYSDVRANYIIGIKCVDGTAFNSLSGAFVVRYAPSCSTPGVILSQKDLLRDKKKLAPEGVLRIFCKFSPDRDYFDKTSTDSATQTEIPEGIHTRTEVREKYLDRKGDQKSNLEEPLPDMEGIYKLVEDFKGLLLSEALSDIVIKIGDREFRAHRAILGARSSVFQSMFSHDTIEQNTGAIEIEDCNPDVFQDFLLSLYSGKVEKLCSENVLHLYALADKYDVQQIKMECLKFMIHNLSLDTFCDTVALALRYNETELLKIATDFFANNTQKIIVTAKWQCFLKEYTVQCNELYLKAIQYRDQE